MIVVSWNVNSLRARLAQVMRYLDEQPPDVLCLQETRVSDAAFPRAGFEERGYHLATASPGGYAGVAIASRQPLDDVVVGIAGHTEHGEPGRRIGGRLGALWIDTVYVPTRRAIGKAEFLDALRADHVARFGLGAEVVLTGDFNICFDHRDLASPGMITEPELLTRRPEDLAWRRLLDTGLVDCFRRRCDDGGHYTWFPHSEWAVARNWGMRLDYVFATHAVAATVVEVSHDPEPRSWKRPSDHLPVRARFGHG